MLTQEQTAHLKEKLLNIQKELREDMKETGGNMENNNMRESTGGELSLYDNHPADMGTELFEREKDRAISVHNKDELEKTEKALAAINKGEYGRCEQCGKDISFERLDAIPYATTCVEHSPDQLLPGDRPVEEDIINPAKNDTFSNRDLSEADDYEDSFEEVASFGTSETPSDFTGDFDSYNELYSDDEREGAPEQYETFVGTDIEGDDIQIYSSENEREYVEKLDEEGIESPIGDIPYRKTDGYVDDKDNQR
ncbi:molecular chaperone DnaK [Bacillus sp. VT-16-64]|nr:molecular chaperone DnaK [Bacillus sp. VT-16-64]